MSVENASLEHLGLLIAAVLLGLLELVRRRLEDRRKRRKKRADSDQNRHTKRA